VAARSLSVSRPVTFFRRRRSGRPVDVREHSQGRVGPVKRSAGQVSFGRFVTLLEDTLAEGAGRSVAKARRR
jgi:hypothetical protein